MAGILLALRAGDRLASPIGLACLVAMFGIFLLAILRLPAAWMDRLRLPTVLTCCSLACWLLAGMIAGGWQMMRLPQAIPADGADAELSGIVRKVDGRLDGRLRIWLQADRVHRGPDLVEGHVVRLSLAPESPLSQAGTYLRVKARITHRPGVFFMARRTIHFAPLRPGWLPAALSYHVVLPWRCHRTGWTGGFVWPPFVSAALMKSPPPWTGRRVGSPQRC